jgi:hypothetical protein
LVGFGVVVMGMTRSTVGGEGVVQG